MDLIIMLVIFGLISSLTKKKKKPQGNRPATSNYPAQQQSNASRGTAVQSKVNEVKKPENVQEGLTSLFNMLAGEEVIKKQKTSDQDRLQKLELEKAKKRSEQEAKDAFEKRKIMEAEAEQSVLDENDALELEIMDNDLPDSAALGTPVPLIISLTEAQNGLIWHEILDKPRALNKTIR